MFANRKRHQIKTVDLTQNYILGHVQIIGAVVTF